MANPNSPVSFLTVQEVADIMRVSTMTVYRMVHAGDIPAIRFGRSFRIPASAVSQMVANAEHQRWTDVG
jgi:excisionase family DNA binding protein